MILSTNKPSNTLDIIEAPTFVSLFVFIVTIAKRGDSDVACCLHNNRFCILFDSQSSKNRETKEQPTKFRSREINEEVKLCWNASNLSDLKAITEPFITELFQIMVFVLVLFLLLPFFDSSHCSMTHLSDFSIEYLIMEHLLLQTPFFGQAWGKSLTLPLASYIN